jgi:hypothetical protein
MTKKCGQCIKRHDHLRRAHDAKIGKGLIVTLHYISRCQHCNSHSIHIIVHLQPLFHVFYILTHYYEIDVLILYTPLYWRLSADGDLSLKHVEGLKFTYNIQFYRVRMLVYINDFKSC